MLKIAVVDVAAEKSGAKTIFDDFISYITDNAECKKFNWDIFTSVLDINETDNIHLIKNPTIKKSWIHRIMWENYEFKKICRNNQYDLIISLQNKTLPIDIPQIVYFHNVLLIDGQWKFSPFKKNELLFFIYSKIIGPLTLKGLKRASLVVSQNKTTSKLLKPYLYNVDTIIIPPSLHIGKQNSLNREGKIKGFIYPSTAFSYKKHDFIVKSIKKYLNNLDLNILFTINGDENEYASSIKELVKDDARFKFIGRIDRNVLMEYYKDYGVINSSYIESYCLPLYEGKRFCTPIVSIDVDYAVEALQDYEYGFISRKNEKDFAEKVKEAYENEYPAIIQKECEETTSWECLIDWIKTNY